jgi:hypothetical protein
VSAKRGWSSADAQQAGPVWHPVAVPTRPNYEGIGEKRAYEDAWASTPRKPGEDVADHMDRVVAAAKAAMGREPGQEG